jgi:hypothetical protein
VIFKGIFFIFAEKSGVKIFEKNKNKKKIEKFENKIFLVI